MLQQPKLRYGLTLKYMQSKIVFEELFSRYDLESYRSFDRTGIRPIQTFNYS